MTELASMATEIGPIFATAACRCFSLPLGIATYLVQLAPTPDRTNLQRPSWKERKRGGGDGEGILNSDYFKQQQQQQKKALFRNQCQMTSTIFLIKLKTF